MTEDRSKFWPEPPAPLPSAEADGKSSLEADTTMAGVSLLTFGEFVRLCENSNALPAMDPVLLEFIGTHVPEGTRKSRDGWQLVVADEHWSREWWKQRALQKGTAVCIHGRALDGQCDECVAQLEREAAEQLEREAAEQLEREKAEQLEREKAEQLEREAAEQLEREKAEQLEREKAEQLEREKKAAADKAAKHEPKHKRG